MSVSKESLGSAFYNFWFSHRYSPLFANDWVQRVFQETYKLKKRPECFNTMFIKFLTRPTSRFVAMLIHLRAMLCFQPRLYADVSALLDYAKRCSEQFCHSDCKHCLTRDWNH